MGRCAPSRRGSATLDSTRRPGRARSRASSAAPITRCGVTADYFQQTWSRLSWHRDAPLSEPAEVAVFHPAQTAREPVKVVLSGEGSDELFGGYPDVNGRVAGIASAVPRSPPCGTRLPTAEQREGTWPNDEVGRKEVAPRHLPADIVDRPTVGFKVPLVLVPGWIARHGVRSAYGAHPRSSAPHFLPAAVGKLRDAHPSGDRNKRATDLDVAVARSVASRARQQAEFDAGVTLGPRFGVRCEPPEVGSSPHAFEQVRDGRSTS